MENENIKKARRNKAYINDLRVKAKCPFQYFKIMEKTKLLLEIFIHIEKP